MKRSLTDIIFILEDLKDEIYKKQRRKNVGIKADLKLTDRWIAVDEAIELLQEIRKERDGF